jgi:putative transposase
MQYHLQRARILTHSIVGFRTDDRYSEGAVNYIPLRDIGDGWEMRHETDPNLSYIVSHADLHYRLTHGLAHRYRRFHSPAIQKLRLIWGDETIHSLDPERQAVALRKEWFVTKYDRFFLKAKMRPFWSRNLDPILIEWNKEHLGIDDDSGARRSRTGRKKRTNQKVEVQTPPSWKSVQRWWNEYHACEQNPLALADRNFGQTQPRLFIEDAKSYAFAYKAARGFLHDLQPSEVDVWRRYQADLATENDTRKTLGKVKLTEVKRTAFMDIIDSFDQFEVVFARRGERYAKEMFGLNAGSVEATVPGQLVQMDYVKIDLITFLSTTGIYAFMPEELQDAIPAVRLWVCVAIDVATRSVLAMKASLTPNPKDVIECLRLMMTDKRDLSEAVGAETPWIAAVVPVVVEMDNGVEFIDDDVIAAFKKAGVGLERKRAKHPSDRPMIESLFATIGPLMTQFFDGRTFRSIAERGNYDAVGRATLYANEFMRFAILSVCDIYQRRDHGSLGGQSPNNRWVELAQSSYTDQLYPAEQLAIFGIAATAHLNDHGIVHAGIPYSNPELQRVRNMLGHNAELRFRYDPFDVREILVRGDTGEFYVRNSVGIDERISVDDWRRARNNLRAEIKENEKESVAVMYRCLARLYASGEASRNRAGLTIGTPTPAQQEAFNREIFKGWVVERDESGTLPRLGPIEPDHDLIARYLLDDVAPPEPAKTKTKPKSKAKAKKKPVAAQEPAPAAQDLLDDDSELTYNDED